MFYVYTDNEHEYHKESQCLLSTAMLIWLTGICFFIFPFAVLGSVPNYTVWLERPLKVEVNSSKNCALYKFFQQGIIVDDKPNIILGDNSNFITFTIPSVSIEFNNVTMTVQAEDNSRRRVHRDFFIFTHG